jgi:probable AcnD-accessory protein PrpF
LAQLTIPAVYMRGGTSKGVFFRGGVLPDDPAIRDAILLRALGSPDPLVRQIDGLGGASSSTSKAVIVSRSTRDDSDLDYLFAQVAIDRPVVDYSGNCGNLSSAVAPFAIEEGLLEVAGERAAVRIWQVNTKKRIIAHVPLAAGLPRIEGRYSIDGVPNPGAEIVLDFLEPGGTTCGELLPTGNAEDRLQIPGLGRVRASLVDAGNPTVVVPAAELGLRGDELQEEVNADGELLERIETIRAHGAVAMGMASDPREIREHRPGTPKIAFVAPPGGYLSSRGERVEASEIDLLARVISMGKLHHAYAITAAVATAVAAAVPGTVAYEAAGFAGDGERRVRLGHPSGRMTLGAEVEFENGRWVARKAVVSRTARRLMEGLIRVPESVAAAAAPVSAP